MCKFAGQSLNAQRYILFVKNTTGSWHIKVTLLKDCIPVLNTLQIVLLICMFEYVCYLADLTHHLSRAFNHSPILHLIRKTFLQTWIYTCTAHHLFVHFTMVIHLPGFAFACPPSIPTKGENGYTF